MTARPEPTLGAMTIEQIAKAFVVATKKRSQARRHLSELRRKWLQDYDMFFDKEESRGEDGYPAMVAALDSRKQCNAEYRSVKSRLFRACKQESK
jgi:hypothetical protein